MFGWKWHAEKNEICMDKKQSYEFLEPVCLSSILGERINPPKRRPVKPPSAQNSVSLKGSRWLKAGRLSAKVSKDYSKLEGRRFGRIMVPGFWASSGLRCFFSTSEGVNGLYAAGTISHSLDFRKSAGGGTRDIWQMC